MFLKSKLSVLIGILLITLVAVPGISFAEQEECKPLESKSIKVEGYFSKKFRKQRKAIKKEFKEMGHTLTRLRAFPMGDTAKVVAVGRCVPAYIARHVLKTALKYTSGIESLVTQAFISPYWIGVGVTMFDEPSQQIVNAQQVEKLLDESLSTEQFHALYAKYTVQDKKVPYFGLKVPNAKIPEKPSESK